MSSLTFTGDQVYNLEQRVVRGGSKEILSFNFYDKDKAPLDITTTRVIWTLSEFGQSDYTILRKEGVLSSDYSCIITLGSRDTKDLEGKFIQQITLVDYLDEEYIPCQEIIKINRNNNDEA